MNKLLIVVIVILALCAVYGYYRGLIRMLFSLVSVFLTVALVALLTPYMTELLRNSTPIYDAVYEKSFEKIKEQAQQQIQQNAEDEIGEISGMQLPEAWSSILGGKAADAADAIMEETGMYDEMSARIAEFVLKAIAGIVTFIAVGLALRILINFLDIVAKLPVIHGMNRMGGLLIGLTEGLLLVWLVLFIIEAGGQSPWAKDLLVQMEQNPVLQFLYQNNGVKYIILRILA